MDNTLIIATISVIGALAGTLIPYTLKTWKDPAIQFDVNYGYAVAVNIVVQLSVMLPDDVPVLTIKTALTAFTSGYGLQAIINKGVSR